MSPDFLLSSWRAGKLNFSKWTVLCQLDYITWFVQMTWQPPYCKVKTLINTFRLAVYPYCIFNWQIFFSFSSIFVCLHLDETVFKQLTCLLNLTWIHSIYFDIKHTKVANSHIHEADHVWHFWLLNWLISYQRCCWLILC